MDRAVVKSFIALPLVYALYITVTCPCDRVLQCHYAAFVKAVAFAALAGTAAVTITPS